MSLKEFHLVESPSGATHWLRFDNGFWKAPSGLRLKKNNFYKVLRSEKAKSFDDLKDPSDSNAINCT